MFDTSFKTIKVCTYFQKRLLNHFNSFQTRLVQRLKSSEYFLYHLLKLYFQFLKVWNWPCQLWTAASKCKDFCLRAKPAEKIFFFCICQVFAPWQIAYFDTLLLLSGGEWKRVQRVLRLSFLVCLTKPHTITFSRFEETHGVISCKFIYVCY